MKEPCDKMTSPGTITALKAAGSGKLEAAIGFDPDRDYKCF